MRTLLTALGAGLLLLSGGLAQAQARTAVDLAAIDDDMAGPRTQVLVLGTVHLSQLEAFDPATLQPVIDRLAAYRPDIITIEDISGQGCDLMARHPAIYGDPADNRFCSAPTAAAAATGLDVPAAIARVHETLATWPDTPTPARRRQLAALFLAADDGASALVQWLRLPESERVADEHFDDTLVALLRKLEASPDESYQVAARLAARLGLERVHPVDDHTGDFLQIDDVDAFAKAIRAAWDSTRERKAPMRAHEKTLIEDGEMLELYRYINSPERLQVQVESDFGAALGDTSPQHFGQRYVGGWETRNLRMVANIREAFRGEPGTRVLSIVGSTHKPWFDQFLGQMQGVDIVDVEQVLR